MLALISQGLGFGFTAGTSFGPLHTILMNVTLAQGWRQGLLIVLSPLITDAPIILLMLFILQQLPESVIAGIQIVGGLAVLRIAYGTWREARADAAAALDAAQAAPANVSRQTLIKGVTVNLLNPGPYIFWGSITGPLLLSALNESLLHGAVFLLSFYGAFLGLMAVFVLIFDRLRGLDPRLTRGLMGVSVVILVLLGLSILWSGITALTAAA